MQKRINNWKTQRSRNFVKEQHDDSGTSKRLVLKGTNNKTSSQPIDGLNGKTKVETQTKEKNE